MSFVSWQILNLSIVNPKPKTAFSALKAQQKNDARPQEEAPHNTLENAAYSFESRDLLHAEHRNSSFQPLSWHQGLIGFQV